MPDREPIKADRITDQVYARIRRLIVRHELAPGTRLSVPALAERFGVSRSPVREAVLQAVRDGLAVEKPRLGAFVARFEPADLRHVFELREALEGMAARLAASRRTKADLKTMTKLIGRQEAELAVDNIEAFVDADIAFHEAVLTAARNPALGDALGQLFYRLRVALSMRVAPTGPDQALADHRAVLSAIEAGDPDAAERAARAHIAQAIRRLMKNGTLAAADGSAAARVQAGL